MVMGAQSRQVLVPACRAAARAAPCRRCPLGSVRCLQRPGSSSPAPAAGYIAQAGRRATLTGSPRHRSAVADPPGADHRAGALTFRQLSCQVPSGGQQPGQDDRAQPPPVRAESRAGRSRWRDARDAGLRSTPAAPSRARWPRPPRVQDRCSRVSPRHRTRMPGVGLAGRPLDQRCGVAGLRRPEPAADRPGQGAQPQRAARDLRVGA